MHRKTGRLDVVPRRRHGPNAAFACAGATHFFLDVKRFDESEFHEHADGRHEHFVVVQREIVERQRKQIQ